MAVDDAVVTSATSASAIGPPEAPAVAAASPRASEPWAEDAEAMTSTAPARVAAEPIVASPAIEADVDV